jgi:hypothetical protein
MSRSRPSRHGHNDIRHRRTERLQTRRTTSRRVRRRVFPWLRHHSVPTRIDLPNALATLAEVRRTPRVGGPGELVGKPIKHAGVAGGSTQHSSARITSRDAAGRTPASIRRLSHSGTTHSNRGEAPLAGLTARGCVLTVSVAVAGRTDAPCSTRWRVNGGRC